jgi:DNA-binding NtrC family response regulator
MAMTWSVAAFFASPAIVAAATTILAIEAVLFVRRRRARRRVMTPRRGSRILVADDQPVVRDAVCLALQRRGYDTVAVDGGRAAEAALSADSGRFSAAVFDVVMPGPGVSDLVALARRLQPDLPVVLMSGSESRSAVDPILAQGNARFLAKPMTPDQLAASIEELMPSTAGEPTAVRIIRNAFGVTILTMLNQG